MCAEILAEREEIAARQPAGMRKRQQACSRFTTRR